MHPFRHSLTTDKCADCAFPELAHGPNAQCECCPAIGPCEIIDGMLMCARCQQRDIEIKAELGISATNGNNVDARVAAIVARTDKTIAIDRRQYFVRRMKSIVELDDELKAAIPNKQDAEYKLAQIVEENLVKLRANITRKHEEIREMQGEAIADQIYLNQIVPQLRAEEREKFKAYDISYKPSVPTATPTVSKPRMSASDRAYESMAKQLGVSVEAYKRNLENAMKNALSVKCTCQETPGVCVIHPTR
jgi:hypothetical protein